jgi:hypothetical protein
MTERGKTLHATADDQIAELTALISTVDEAALRLPCPGREKLGDGTVAASAQHTADNYRRIAGFVETSDRMSAAHEPTHDGAHRIPGFSASLATGRQPRPTRRSVHGRARGSRHRPFTALGLPRKPQSNRRAD